MNRHSSWLEELYLHPVEIHTKWIHFKEIHSMIEIIYLCRNWGDNCGFTHLILFCTMHSSKNWGFKKNKIQTLPWRSSNIWIGNQGTSNWCLSLICHTSTFHIKFCLVFVLDYFKLLLPIRFFFSYKEYATPSLFNLLLQSHDLSLW